MSKRETITQDIVECLSNLKVGLVTRNPFDYQQLSRQQYPALFVASADEERSYMTMGTVGSGRKQSRLEIAVVGYVQGAGVDELRNTLIEQVESALESDITRSGVARTTLLRDVIVDFSVVEPYGRVDMTIVVEYDYIRGEA